MRKILIDNSPSLSLGTATSKKENLRVLCFKTLALLSAPAPVSRTPAVDTPWGSGETSLAPRVGPPTVASGVLRPARCADATQPHRGLRCHPLCRQESARKKAGSGCEESPCPKYKKRALLTANKSVLRHVAVREAPAQHPPRHRGNASVQPQSGASATPFELCRQASIHKIIQLEHNFR